MPAGPSRRSLTRAMVALAVAVSTSLTFGGPALGAAVGIRTETDVHGNDDRDAYVGTGGLILPASVDPDTRRVVASCPDCRWRLATPCEIPAAGTAFDGQPACLSVVRGCPGGHLLRSWFRGGSQPWRDLGLVCIPPGGPVTVAGVARELRGGFERGIPVLRPGFQPTQGVLTQIPVVLDSGQPAGPRTWRVELLGRDVTLTATPAWSWQFGDGTGLATADPGGHFPHLEVAHVYRRAGDYRVACTTTWSGSFVVDGLGPFPVAEPVRQTEVRWIEVGEGRALLAPARMTRARPPG